jgi:hypothetical protein
MLFMAPMLACSGAAFGQALDSYSPYFYRPCPNNKKERSMKRRMIMAAALLLASPLALAYQVTGPVVEMTDSKIVVKKGKENWDIARDAGTKVASDVKVGDRVTVDYKMTATSIEPNAKKKPRAKTKNKDQ